MQFDVDVPAFIFREHGIRNYKTEEPAKDIMLRL